MRLCRCPLLTCANAESASQAGQSVEIFAVPGGRGLGMLVWGGTGGSAETDFIPMAWGELNPECHRRLAAARGDGTPPPAAAGLYGNPSPPAMGTGSRGAWALCSPPANPRSLVVPWFLLGGKRPRYNRLLAVPVGCGFGAHSRGGAWPFTV